MAKRGGLGKGLDALFQENAAPQESAREMKISEIEPNKQQPRREFEEQALSELSESIARHGVLQPLIVRPLPGGTYQIVAGERRWRASRMAGLQTVPVIVRELSDRETAELALIENLQREDLSPVEEGEGYVTLMETYGMTQEQVAERVGKSRPAVANAVRLLSLPPEILQLLKEGSITAGHARAILSFSTVEEMQKAAQMAQQGATVRMLENAARKKPDSKKNGTGVRTKLFEETALSLTEVLGRRVRVSGSRSKGVLEIEFYGEEDLLQLANRIAEK
ncbi:MAG: ParB/RepB/Spo0J family partition protein [Clostridia bacterium]|nr:ParB/RepB/Spo0J family partition protein [Clostridia bacterium]